MSVIVTAIGYGCVLFLLAWWGDRGGRRFIARGRPLIYSLSLAVYCTTWTYYGSVGIASAHGLDFLPIYIGPVLVIGFGRGLVARIAALARAQNITSVADFVAARYGKAQPVAAMVALIAVFGAAPYIALQLKAIGQTMMMLVASFEQGRLAPAAPSSLFFLAVALLLAAFAMAFGTRRIDPTEHQDGLILAIAAESLVKLVAFLAVGAFVVWGMFGGLGELARLAAATPRIAAVMASRPDPATWIATTLLSACAILLLPRQFHVTIVENREARDVRTAAWLFPAYLVAINLFVAPLAIAGLATFADGAIDRDLTVLALPLSAGARGLALLTMIGGLSAAIAMVVVESVALSINVSNDLAMPLLLRRRGGRAGAGDIGALVLLARRGAILFVLVLGWAYVRVANEAALASLGLLSFAAIAQIAPAFFGGLFWRRANARGATAGLVAGALAWIYTLLLPSLELGAGFAQFLDHGPLAIAWLRPAALFAWSANPLVNGAASSLGLNVAAFIAFSLTRQANPIERMQADVFVGGAPTVKAQAFRLWRAAATVGELEATVARYLGAERARSAFAAFLGGRGAAFDAEREADAHLIRHAEHLLASAIGGSSARLVMSLLFRRRAMSRKSALRLIDDASSAIQSNRDLLQHALDHARQGVTVFDRNLALTCWNREFCELFDLPPTLMRLGVGLEEIVRFNAERGVYGPGAADDFVAERIESQLNEPQPLRLRLHPSLRVIEIRSARLPDGGIVTTYTDVTDSVEAEERLAAANERLERRVRERTEELERLNGELARAKTEAEEANASKTRFLAAASHDILQPLNAARLYSSALNEASGAGAEDQAALARNVDASLEAVEEILSALLDISRLDAGATRPEITDAPVGEILAQLAIEFAPMARAKGLKLTFVPSSLTVRSDRRLLRRLLRNLVSNAIKYTPRGRVLVGCRRRAGALRIEVWDTGMGIPPDQQRVVFEEFRRLDQGARAAPGLGLGLSIVQRLARVLGHDIALRSRAGAGSIFAVTAPLGARAGARPTAAVAEQQVRAREPLDALVVLAIDNEPRVVEGLRALLGNWGCRVAVAAGAGDAVAAMRAFGAAPDVVVADYHLDDGDGVAAIAAVRRAFGAELPAILATADRSPEVREAALGAGVSVLHKPVKPAQLRALLMRCRTMQAAAE